MEYRQLGNSRIKASAISFGAWAIGGWQWGGTDRKEAIEALKVSFDEGVTSIDTAPAYGQGLSEEIVGEAIKDLPRGQIQIMTKFGLRWNTTKGDFFFDSRDRAGNQIKMHNIQAKKTLSPNVRKACGYSVPIILIFINSTGPIVRHRLQKQWKH